MHNERKKNNKHHFSVYVILNICNFRTNSNSYRLLDDTRKRDRNPTLIRKTKSCKTSEKFIASAGPSQLVLTKE